jgi:hypothetical protein
VSRIWDALKEAEQERSRSNSRDRASRGLKTTSERRKSRRSLHCVPLLVYGSDAEKQPFHEEAETLEVNDHGCLLAIENEVVRGQRLFLTNTSNQAEHECRVVHVGKRVRGKAKIGVAFLRPAPRFWLKG